MGRKRTKRKDLPQRVYFQHGGYYFVSRDGKWNNLGRDYVDAMTAYAKLNSVPRTVTNMGALFDRYEREVIPAKAPRTQKDNVKELRFLRHAFGHMNPNSITPQDIYAYMDARKAPVRANREKALLSHVFSYAIRWGVVADNPVETSSATRKNHVVDMSTMSSSRQCMRSRRQSFNVRWSWR